MDQLSGDLPPMPKATPLLGQFFVASLVLVGMSLVSTVISLNIDEKCGNVPSWVRCIFLGFLPRVLCMTPPKQHEMRKESEGIKELISNLTAKTFHFERFLSCKTDQLLSDILKGKKENR